MRKGHVKLFVFMLVIAMLASSVSVFAIDSTIVPLRYEKVMECAAALKISSRGYAACSGELQLRNGATADMTVTLLSSENKSSWTPVDSWETSGSSWLVIDDGCYVMSGKYYAVKVSADVYSSDGTFIEHVYTTSNIVQY